MFQNLQETEQQRFLVEFEQHDVLREVLEIALDVQTSVIEIESIVPSILPKDHVADEIALYHEQLKANTEKRDNVYYVPFGKQARSPFIIIMQQSKDMEDISTYMKGLILPLFNLCAKQRRDLIIVPFQEEVIDEIIFTNGVLHVGNFSKWLNIPMKGKANIMPALNKAIALFEEDTLNDQRELFIVANNNFFDKKLFEDSVVAEKLVLLNVETSVITTSEQQFEQMPISFAQKVYFIDEV